MIRGSQDVRKNAGPRIENTIRLVYSGSDKVAGAIASFTGYIRAEMLARELVVDDADGAAHSEDVVVGVTRVGSPLAER